jgi:flagellar hook-associated protein 1 FlgK
MPITDNPDGNYDSDNDGVSDVSAIFRVTGNNRIDASAAIGIAGTLTFVTNDELEQQVQIDYNENDTVLSVLQRINDAHIGIVAYINHNSQLAVKSTVAQDSDSRNFMIRHLEDSGQFLVGLTGILAQSGPQGSFEYHRVDDIRKFLPTGEHITITPQLNPASYVSISAGIQNNVDRIAAARGEDIGGTGDVNESNGIGDGTNALRLARLRHINGMVDQSVTFNDFLVSVVSRIGTQGEEAEDRLRSQETLLTNLENLRQSVSGVNLDEEMANMVAFQHGYNAAARVLSMIDQMLSTIINMGARG